MRHWYLPKKEIVWLLFDAGNGDTGGCRYVWWFDTRKAARIHKAEQKKNPNAVKLVGPFKYRREE